MALLVLRALLAPQEILVRLVLKELRALQAQREHKEPQETMALQA